MPALEIEQLASIFGLPNMPDPLKVIDKGRLSRNQERRDLLPDPTSFVPLEESYPIGVHLRNDRTSGLDQRSRATPLRAFG
jgi:hypothetical protein